MRTLYKLYRMAVRPMMQHIMMTIIVDLAINVVLHH